MCCHGIHAFSHSPNQFIYELFFRIQGVPGNNIAPIQNCPFGARYVKLDPGVAGLRLNQFIYDVCLCFHLIYKALINILEYANEVISYTTTR